MQGNCTHCGGLLTYQADQIGLMSQCPYCQQQTELNLAEPKIESGVPRKAIVLSLVAVVILSGGLVGSMVALKRAQKWATTRNQETPSSRSIATTPGSSFASTLSTVQDGLMVSGIELQKTSGNKLGHVVGSVTNLLSRPRTKVTIELELFDASGTKVGLAMDSTPVIPPGTGWGFRAPVLTSSATRARLSSIKEQL